MKVLNILGRKAQLFKKDIESVQKELLDIVSTSKFLVLGGAGSIGQAVTKEIFKRNPKKLHVVDISENNLVELVRDVRSALGYISGDFKTFVLDIGSEGYDTFITEDGNYDYVINLSALKHVRSEKDPYTLMRLMQVNIFNTEKTLQQSILKKVKKYFSVSTDKATNPVNVMGASKKLMEMLLISYSNEIQVSSARFANVAFSDGSLLYGFEKRILKQQPLVAPNDIKRYFITAQESGELCLLSCIFGDNRDLFFPKLNSQEHLKDFPAITKRYLNTIGFTAFECKTEEEARQLVKTLPKEGKWPCLFPATITTGEKDIEAFYTKNEVLDQKRFEDIGIIKKEFQNHKATLEVFSEQISKWKTSHKRKKQELIKIFEQAIPNFTHDEKNNHLDQQM